MRDSSYSMSLPECFRSHVSEIASFLAQKSDPFADLKTAFEPVKARWHGMAVVSSDSQNVHKMR